MPARAPSFCVVPGCPALTTRGRCAAHWVQAERSRPNYDRRRWYRTPAWKALRAEIFLDAAYTCTVCGRVEAALEVDHTTKHNGDPARFWNRGNLQALCRRCHQQKTRRGE